MHKKFKILVATVLICSITFVSYGEEFVQNQTSNQNELNELQEQRNEIQVQIDESNTELSNIGEELTENLQQIQKLDENIQTSEKNLEELNSEISKMEEEVFKVEGELQEVTEKYNIQKDILDKRLVAVYENGSNNYLEALLGSRNIVEFISTYFLISEITSYDKDLLDLVKQEKNQIEERSLELNSKTEELETQKRNQQRAQIALSNTKLLRANYISKLSEEEKTLQSQIDEYYKQINEVEAEIRNLVVLSTLGKDYQGGVMHWPIYGHYTVTSKYGMRTHPITGVYKLHTGVDIGANIGDPFTAIADGVVVKAAYNAAYGNMVIIDHGGGVQTLYAHGSSIEVQVGQSVKAGDLILKVGMTGYATGPHAHFEIRINGETLDPLDFLAIPGQPETEGFGEKIQEKLQQITEQQEVGQE